MQTHISTHQLDIGSQIDEMVGIERTKEQIAMSLIKKTIALGINLGIERKDLLSAVIDASFNLPVEGNSEFSLSAEADLLITDYCHVAGFDLDSHKVSLLATHMQDFVQSNYKPQTSLPSA